MYTKFKISIYSILVLAGILGLAGCGLLPAGNATQTPVGPRMVLGPEAARDVALAYIRTYHPGTGPMESAIWFVEAGSSGGLSTSSTVQYRYEGWLVQVTYPTGEQADVIYSVTVSNPSTGFLWQGLVDAAGQVAETSFAQASPTPTVQPPTDTPAQPPTEAATQTATPTATQPPTRTPTPFPTRTPPPQPCSMAEFVTDVTVQDGTIFVPGTAFTKVWRLKNVGHCAWTTDYDLVFVDGRLMGGEQSMPLPGVVKLGQTIDLAMDMQAPQESGDYQGLWMLRDAQGKLFGLGGAANKPFWVSITVVDFGAGDYNFDFTLEHCAAKWRSEEGKLPCPGFTDSSDGFVQLLVNAELENRRENEPTLWVHPNEERYGWIEGTFPGYKVKAGDHFRAWVGCLKGYQRCSLTFYLDYLDTDGRVRRLGEWVEDYDGLVTEIDIDLTDLEGDKVRFILGVEANTKNVDDAQGFWFVPRVE